VKKLIFLYLVLGGFNSLIKSAAGPAGAPDEGKEKKESVEISALGIDNIKTIQLFQSEFAEKLEFMHGKDRYDFMENYLEVIEDAIRSVNADIRNMQEVQMHIFDQKQKAVNDIQLLIYADKRSILSSLYVYVYNKLLSEFDNIKIDKIPGDQLDPKPLIDEIFNDLDDVWIIAVNKVEIMEILLTFIIQQMRSAHKAQVYFKEQYDKAGSAGDIIEFVQNVAVVVGLDMAYSHFYDLAKDMEDKLKSEFPEPEAVMKAIQI